MSDTIYIIESKSFGKYRPCDGWYFCKKDLAEARKLNYKKIFSNGKFRISEYMRVK